MTSQINPNNIDGNYPVAGQDNSSQGFRDNFTNTKQNFQYAYDEISALQANAVVGGANISNDLQGATLSNVALIKYQEVVYDFGSTSGAITYNYNNGSFQTITMAGSISSVTFTNVPSTANRAITIKLEVVCNNTANTITWPASVSLNLSSLAYQSGQTTRFTNTGTYIFQLTTIDGGTTWHITDLSRNRSVFQGNVTVQTIVSNAAATGISFTVSNVAGAAYGVITANSIVVDTVTSTGNAATYSGNINCANLIASVGIYGNIKTASQPNITLVGTLTSLSVSGNANVGNLTVTGMSDFCGGDMVGVQFATAANTGSTQIYSNVGFVLINPSTSTIASHTITMPATPSAGQVLRIGFANTITTLTQAGYGSDSVYGGLTTANTAGGTTWIYYKTANVNSGNGVWYRIG